MNTYENTAVAHDIEYLEWEFSTGLVIADTVLANNHLIVQVSTMADSSSSFVTRVIIDGQSQPNIEHSNVGIAARAHYDICESLMEDSQLELRSDNRNYKLNEILKQTFRPTFCLKTIKKQVWSAPLDKAYFSLMITDEDGEAKNYELSALTNHEYHGLDDVMKFSYQSRSMFLKEINKAINKQL